MARSARSAAPIHGPRGRSVSSRVPIAASVASANATSTAKRAGARIAWNPNTQPWSVA